MEYEPQGSGGGHSSSGKLTLLKAVELGEYDPEVLSRFSEWHLLSKHAQFQLVRKALVNRDLQLRSTWADINNQLNFSKKPYLHAALKNIEREITHLRSEEDRMYILFTSS